LTLFPALKERVRVNKRPGQFILSGPVRFTSRKAIRESLTGRIVNLELLPMTMSEIKQMDVPDILPKIMESKNLMQLSDKISYEIKNRQHLIEQVETYERRGGLPGICFIRDEKMRQNKIQEQLRTILDRDIRLIFPTTLSHHQIIQFVQHLAEIEGTPIQYSKIKRITKLSEETQKKLLYALEAVFLIRIMPLDGERHD